MKIAKVTSKMVKSFFFKIDKFHTTGTKISPRFLADLTYVFGVQTPDLDSIREPSKNKFNGVLRHLMYFASKNYFLYYIESIE